MSFRFHLFFNNYLLVALMAVFFSSFAQYSQAEVIDIKNEEKIFGDWKVFCETDVMMDISNCKVAAKFYENLAVINVEPGPKFINKLFIVIPQLVPGSVVKLRVTGYDIIVSNPVQANDFGLIVLTNQQKADLYRQMRKGKDLFLRFTTYNSDKEITVRLSLTEFRNAMSYYNSKVNQQ